MAPPSVTATACRRPKPLFIVSLVAMFLLLGPTSWRRFIVNTRTRARLDHAPQHDVTLGRRERRRSPSVDDFFLIRDLVRDGAGVGLLPGFVADAYARDGCRRSPARGTEAVGAEAAAAGGAGGAGGAVGGAGGGRAGAVGA